MASSASRGTTKSRPSNLKDDFLSKEAKKPFLKLIKTVGGEKGSGDGQFDNPTSLAVTAEGDIVVADRNNKRLQFLCKDGAFKTKVDLGFQPWCVAASPSGDLLVTGDGHSIHVLDKQGRESRVFQVKGADATGGRTMDIEGITVDGKGRIIITIMHQVFEVKPKNGDLLEITYWTSYIHIMDKQWRESRVTIEVEGAATLGGMMDIDDGIRKRRIMIDDNQVFEVIPNGNRLKIGYVDQVQGMLGPSLRVAAKGNNQIIVSDLSNQSLKIFKYDDTARPRRYRSQSVVPNKVHHDKLDCPWSVITDGDDIIVADYQNHCVSMFNPNGKFMKHMLTREDGGLNYPMGLALTRDRHLVVSDMHSVKMFR